MRHKINITKERKFELMFDQPIRFHTAPSDTTCHFIGQVTVVLYLRFSQQSVGDVWL